MKKLKTLKIYKVYNIGTGDEIFTNFKPSKKDLLEIAKDECWTYNEEEEHILKNMGYSIIDIYEKVG